MNDLTINASSILNHIEEASRAASQQGDAIMMWANDQRAQHAEANDVVALSNLRDRIGFVIETIQRPGPAALVRELANDMVRITQAIDDMTRIVDTP